jgi:hypothetical protein
MLTRRVIMFLKSGGRSKKQRELLLKGIGEDLCPQFLDSIFHHGCQHMAKYYLEASKRHESASPDKS